MIRKIKQFSDNPFVKNVSTLALGTTFAQVIVVATSPLLSRLFKVETFGQLSLFTSIVTICSVISTGRYELAIVLPDSNKKAFNILGLIVCFSNCVALIYLIIIFLFRNLANFNNTSIFKNWIAYLIPAYVVLAALNSGLLYWAQRSKDYRKVSLNNILQAIATCTISIVLGLLYPNNYSLIIALFVGMVCSSAYLIISQSIFQLKSIITFKEIKKVSREYKSFPRYMIFSDLAQTVGQQYIPILFSMFFSPLIVGFYSMANRMIRLPNIMITTSIANVFRNDAIEAIRKFGNCKDLYLSTLKKLIAMSLPIYLAIFLLSPLAFRLGFGNNWLEAGYFARILSPLLLTDFVATPLNSILYLRGKQKIYMRLQIINVFSGTLMIFLGYFWFDDARTALSLYSGVASLFNILFIWFSFKFSQ